MTKGPLAFEAYVTHPSLGDEVAWGRIVFEGWKLRFESEGIMLAIPLVKLEIARDSDQGGLAFWNSQDEEWVVHTLQEEILAQAPLLQQPHTRHQIQGLQGSMELTRRFKIIGVFLAGFVGLALGVSALMGMMVSAVVARVPVEWEQEFGDKVMAELREKETFVEDAKMQTNLLRAVAPLLATVPTNALGFKLYLMKHPLPNAFALPGGHVVVTTSLMDLADRPEEIAGVIAHEVAHVNKKHVFRKIISSSGPYILCRLFMRDNSGLLGVLAGSSQLLVAQSFSQEYETEADDVGWQYLVNAHIDPRGLPDMLRRLQSEYESMHLGNLMPQAFSSHPATDKRIRRLQAKWETLKDKSGFVQYEPAKRE
jgi:beta-barrel assembly-enhancing protease